MSVAAWNVKSGGIEGYSMETAYPERMPHIKKVVSRLGGQALDGTWQKPDVFMAIDAFRWGEIFDGPEGIAKELGYRNGAYTLLHDESLAEQGNGAAIGTAIVTDHEIEKTEVFSMGTRDALSVVVDGNRYVATYLDHLRASTRMAQFRTLMQNLRLSEYPTVLAGDFNDLRPRLERAKRRHKLGDGVLRFGGLVLQPFAEKSSVAQQVSEMSRNRRLIPEIRTYGLRDADEARQRPTMPTTYPVFGIDYAFYTPESLEVTDFEVVNDADVRKASDHCPIRFMVSGRA